MYTRSRQNQGYGNGRNSNNPQHTSGPYAASPPYNTKGSYQSSQSSYNQQSDYKQDNVQNLQGFKSQQQQQPAQMPAGSPTRSLQQMKTQVTQQLHQQLSGQAPQLQQQQVQQQMQQQQVQQQMQQQQVQQQLQQQQVQQQMQQQIHQQQQVSAANSSSALPPRLKPILKQASSPSSVPQGIPVTSQPGVLAPSSTSNNKDTNEEKMQIDCTGAEMQEQPKWRRKTPGFKVNKKLKRLRMNQRLRKTLQPKNAIMVLNEMKAGCQFTFPETQGSMPNSLYLVHAELDGKTYVGQGLSKPLARQNAAENALKALLLEKMTTASMKARIDAESDEQNNQVLNSTKNENNDECLPMDTNTSENDEIPWSSVASFALYKLFLEWHNQGTSVPVPRPGLPPTKGAKKESLNVTKTSIEKELPPNPTGIHPVMLLNQMKPGLTYVELSRIGNPPNTMFTLAVEVNGMEYSGTAKNKKDAKKAAAKAALLALYGLIYPTDTSEDMVSN